MTAAALSTFTLTLPIRVPTMAALSRAQPLTVMVPETVEPLDGASIQTVGGCIPTFTVTLE